MSNKPDWKNPRDQIDLSDNSITFHFKGIPFSKQSFRFARFVTKENKTVIRKYQPKKIIDAENTIRAQIIAQLPRNFVPYSKGVVVYDLTFTFPLPSSCGKKIKERVGEGWTYYKATKPDLTDNLMKGLFDAMSGLVYNNDSRIVSIMRVRKIYGTTPGIEITLDQIENVVL